jgi:hypothetical protein
MSEFIRQRQVRSQERLRPATSLSFRWKSSNLEAADDTISPGPWTTQGRDLAISEPEPRLSNDQPCEMKAFQPGWNARKLPISNIADPSHARGKATRLSESKYMTRRILQTPRQRAAPKKASDYQFLAFFQSQTVGGDGEFSLCACPTSDLARLGGFGAIVDRGTPSHPQKPPSIYGAAGICRSCGCRLIWGGAAATSIDRQVPRFEANVPDPFAVYPIPKTPHMHRLIHHCE